MEPDPRYPTGRFQRPTEIAPEQRTAWIADIEQLPQQLRAATDGLSDEQLETPYRPGGWTVRQVVHHVADSHINAWARFKLALTEDEPTIKPYAEARWAELEDARVPAVEVSLRLLEALHARWTVLLRSLGTEEFQRGFRHPEHSRVMSLEETLALYSWHGKHHVAHVTSLRSQQGW
jgi:uncharacterized damage-inducible protein DinB